MDEFSANFAAEFGQANKNTAAGEPAQPQSSAPPVRSAQSISVFTLLAKGLLGLVSGWFGRSRQQDGKS